MNKLRIKLRIAALMGFIGVALGAFGAHGLSKRFAGTENMDIWKTAVFYHLVHAVVLLALALAAPPRAGAAYWSFLIGIVVFCGSLYLMALSNITVLGAITPLGGAAFLLGWGQIFFKARHV